MSKVCEMSIESFIDVPDKTRQRNTESHARKAIKGHLSEVSPTHDVVSVASIDGSIVCKLDGHTRAYLWETGDLPTPSSGKVSAVVYPVRNMKEAAELYTHFDNQAAMEASSDRLFGACRENGLHLTSPLLRPMKFLVALRLANGEAYRRKSLDTEYSMVKTWREYLATLDSWELPTMPGPLTALALMAIRWDKHTEDVKTFYQRFAADDGVKNGKERDGVQALSEHLMVRRTNNTLTGWDNLIDFAERALTCLNAHINNRPITSGVRRTKLSTLRSNNRAKARK